MIGKEMLGEHISRRDRIKAESEGKCPTCEQVLWLSFYFDGFGCSEKEVPTSNLLKLYRAGYDEPPKGMQTFYYPGLGADFDAETSALVAALAEKASDAIVDKAREEVVNTAKDKAKETAASSVKHTWARSAGIRANSLPKRLQWTIGQVWDEAKEAAGSTGRQVKRAVNYGRYFHY
jgi:hypothetical protein